MKDRYICIMAGGIGSRFWPASSDETPKQFLDIIGTGKSLLRTTFERFNEVYKADKILVLTNQRYKAQVKEHIPEIPEQNILLEPSRNNTAPCIAYAALKIHNQNPNATFCVAPADHIILKENTFLSKLGLAFDFAEMNDAIITMGIMPTRPDTGYGYIEVNRDEVGDIIKVTSFKEKPDMKTASDYLSSGNYFWNAGIFIWHTKTIIESFEKNEPDIIKILNQQPEKFNTEDEQAYIDEVYPSCPKISVDYAILEREDRVYTVPADIGWSDLGTWNSLYSFLPSS